MTSKSNKQNTTINEALNKKLKEPETIISTSTKMTSEHAHVLYVGDVRLEMYSIDRLVKDNKLIDTKAFHEWLDEAIESAGVQDTENPLEELEMYWNNMGMSRNFNEECILQRVNGMLKEKKLVYNPRLGHGGYYINPQAKKPIRRKLNVTKS